MGRGVEDLSGRCHVKRMSRRKERLGFFFCATLSSLMGRKEKRTRARALGECARVRLTLAQAAPLYYLSKCISLKNCLHSRGLRHSRQRLSVLIWGDKFSMSRNLRADCILMSGARGINILPLCPKSCDIALKDTTWR